jgi:hypothetical protein
MASFARSVGVSELSARGSREAHVHLAPARFGMIADSGSQQCLLLLKEDHELTGCCTGRSQSRVRWQLAAADGGAVERRR